MALSKEEIEKISNLARIRLSDQEKEKLAEELSHIIDYFEKLKQVDTASVDLHLAETADTNALREDESKDSQIQNQILENAPMRDGKSIKVKSVL